MTNRTTVRTLLLLAATIAPMNSARGQGLFGHWEGAAESKGETMALAVDIERSGLGGLHPLELPLDVHLKRLVELHFGLLNNRPIFRS